MWATTKTKLAWICALMPISAKLTGAAVKIAQSLMMPIVFGNAHALKKMMQNQSMTDHSTEGESIRPERYIAYCCLRLYRSKVQLPVS